MRERQANELLYDVYLQALAVREREGIPVHGPSIQRRIIEYTQQVYNDSMIRALVCCLCTATFFQCQLYPPYLLTGHC
jgi:hypothetical protein